MSEFVENLESEDGTWEYLRNPKEDKVSFQYWKENDGYPSEEIIVTVKEFNDLIGFMKTLNPLK